MGQICNVLARLEREWTARSYHFLTHNCTDFAEALSKSLDLPIPFPSWAHGLAKGIAKKDGSTASAPWWIPSPLVGCCANSCASQSECCRSEVEGPYANRGLPCSAAS